MIYSVFGKAPAPPASYPATIEYVDHYGRKTAVLENEDAYYALIFFRWMCSPVGFSQVKPDGEIRHDTINATD